MNWKQRLLQYREAYYKVTYPNACKDHGVPDPKPYKDSTANGLTRCIEDWITFQFGYVNRISTTGLMRTINGREVWCKGNTNKGAADLRFLFLGKSGDVEIKIGADRMSDAQLKEMERVQRAGGLYFIAKDMESFVAWWDEIFQAVNQLPIQQSVNYEYK